MDWFKLVSLRGIQVNKKMHLSFLFNMHNRILIDIVKLVIWLVRELTKNGLRIYSKQLNCNNEYDLGRSLMGKQRELENRRNRLEYNEE